MSVLFKHFAPKVFLIKKEKTLHIYTRLITSGLFWNFFEKRLTMLNITFQRQRKRPILFFKLKSSSELLYASSFAIKLIRLANRITSLQYVACLSCFFTLICKWNFHHSDDDSKVTWDTVNHFVFDLLADFLNEVFITVWLGQTLAWN